MSKNIIISFIQFGKGELERAALAVPEDKLNWKPLDNGRSALDALGDAAQSPLLVAGIIKGTVKFGPEYFKQLAQERAGWSREQALEMLEKNTNELIAAIQEFPDDRLEEPLTRPFGGGTTMPWGSWMLMSYRSFMSRTAQINYIQTLYGDSGIH